MKKIFIIILTLFMFFGLYKVNAKNNDLVLSNGNTVYYSGTNIAVQIPTEYNALNQYFRGAWVTPLAGSIPSYKNETQYKNEILEMFDILEYYNINALIFHIRIMNDALYPSKLNPRSSYLDSSTDMLPWIIEESHKRGIEFHAWMNPYRVQASGSKDLSKITAKYASYKNNPASDASNLLMNSKNGGVILNPCLENVRKFIIDTVIEVLDNYDVDAIHFDDYFYIDNVDDDAYYKKSNPNNLSKSDWRREQVNTFIEDLSVAMRNYNKENNRYVQFGISPTGIYNNGDGEVTYDENGNAITTGSATGGQCHYESYLFSDTLKWINNEWIDYICPQSYWAFSHPIAGYADVMSWWNKVCKYKKVNLYSGMGIYMSETVGSNYSWGFDPNEAPNQILYASTLENVQGISFYSYNYLEYAYKGAYDTLYGEGLSIIKEKLFNNPAILPHIKSMSCEANKVSNIISVDKTETNISFTFAAVENAKFYCVYRSKGTIDYSADQVYKIFGSTDTNITFTDTVESGSEYNYGIKVLAKDNSLSEGTLINVNKYKVTFKDINGNILKESETYYGGTVTAPTAPEVEGKKFIGWSKDFSSVKSDLDIYPKYNDSTYTVKFYNYDGNILKTEEVAYNGSATPPECLQDGFVFDKWDTDYTNVKYDLDIYPIFKPRYCNVSFVDYDGKVLLSYEILYGEKGYFPANPTRKDYDFVKWSETLDKVTDDITVTPIYEKQKITVTIISNVTNEVIFEFEVFKNSDVDLPTPPEVYGYKFVSWEGNYKNVTSNIKIKACYEEIYYNIKFTDEDGNVLLEQNVYWFEDIEYPEEQEKEGYVFVGWDTDLTKLPSDKEELIVKPLFAKNTIKITFLDSLDNVIYEKTFNYKEEIGKQIDIEYPNAPEVTGYEFIGWDNEVTNNWEDQVIKALYEVKKFKVTFVGYNDEVIKEEMVEYGKNVDLTFDVPDVAGYKFVKFSHDGTNITEDITINLVYEKSQGFDCKFYSVYNLFISLSLIFVSLRIFKKH